MIDIVGLDELEKGRELVLGEQGLDFHVLAAGETALDLVEAAAALEFVHYEVAQPFVFFGNHTDTLALVDARHEVVHHDSVNPGTHKTDYNQMNGVDEEGRAADDGAAIHRLPILSVVRALMWSSIMVRTESFATE